MLDTENGQGHLWTEWFERKKKKKTNIIND